MRKVWDISVSSWSGVEDSEREWMSGEDSLLVVGGLVGDVVWGLSQEQRVKGWLSYPRRPLGMYK